MKNIISYIEEYGHLSFSQRSFNEIDALIFSQVVYFDFNQLNLWSVKRFSQISNQSMVKYITRMSFNTAMDQRFLTLLIESNRYKDICWHHFVETVDIENQQQFAAITFQLTDDLAYIAIRGTDVSFLGWKENFNMAFLEYIPSQSAAQDYAETIMAESNSRFYIGGHSKGGHLATFAGIQLRKDYRRRLIKIFNFDGPGFINHQLAYQAARLNRLIYKVVPQGSMIGVLFEDYSNFSIIRSNGSGYWQHDPFTWEIEGCHFKTVDNLEITSKYILETVPTWLEKVDNHTKAQVIDALYQIAINLGLETVFDIEPIKLQHFKLLTNELRNMPIEAQSGGMLLIKKLFESSIEEAKERFHQKKNN